MKKSYRSFKPIDRLYFLNIAFSSIIIIMALGFEELYPFTISPMFRDNQFIYTRYFVKDSSGQNFHDWQLNLHQLYNGNPTGLGVGQKPSISSNEIGKILNEYEITSVIDKEGSKIKNLKFPLTIEQVVYGPVKGSPKYGVVKRKIIIINAK